MAKKIVKVYHITQPSLQIAVLKRVGRAMEHHIGGSKNLESGSIDRHRRL
jgi:hypothetical protein